MEINITHRSVLESHDQVSVYKYRSYFEYVNNDDISHNNLHLYGQERGKYSCHLFSLKKETMICTLFSLY